MLTPEELAEIEAAEQAATPGPWEPGHVWLTAGLIFDADRNRVEDGTATHCAYCHLGPPEWSGRMAINSSKKMPAHRHRSPEPYEPDHLISGAGGAFIAGNYDYEAGGILRPEDTAFVVAARSAVPALLAEVRQLTEDRDRARDAAVALEQQLAEIKRLAYLGGQDGEIVRRWILGVFEDDRRALKGGEASC